MLFTLHYIYVSDVCSRSGRPLFVDPCLPADNRRAEEEMIRPTLKCRQWNQTVATLMSVSFRWMWEGRTSVHLQTFHFHSCSGSFGQLFPVDHQLFIIKSPLSGRPPDSSDVPEPGAVAPGPSPLSRPRSALRVAVAEATCFHTKQRDGRVESPFHTMKY